MATRETIVNYLHQSKPVSVVLDSLSIRGSNLISQNFFILLAIFKTPNSI